jgi:hypothetical protein
MGSAFVSDENDTGAGALRGRHFPGNFSRGSLRVGNKLPTLRKMKRVQSFPEIALLRIGANR